MASPAAVSGFAGTMMSQLTFAAATGAVVADAEGQGVDVGVAVVVGVAVAVEVAVALGVGVTVGMAVVVGVGVGVAVVAGAVVAGAVVAGAVVAGAVVAGAVVGATVMVETGAGGKCRWRLPLGDAAADVLAAPAMDVDGVAEAPGEDVVQALARFAALLEALSLLVKWGAIRNAIPTASTTTMSPATAARRRRGRSSNCR